MAVLTTTYPLSRAEVPWFDHVDQVSSTNDELPLRAHAHLATLVADRQSAGRGRLGREWVSAPGASLTASTLVVVPHTDGMARRLGWLTVAGALAARAGVGEVIGSDDLGISWPNDLVASGGKLGGVLGELTDTSTATLTACVGIGINLDIADDALPTPVATSLRQLGYERADADAILAAYLRHLRTRVDAFIESDADPAALIAELERYCITIGRDVTVKVPNPQAPGGIELVHGHAESIDSTGALTLHLPGGNHRTITAGEIEWFNADIQTDNPTKAHL